MNFPSIAALVVVGACFVGAIIYLVVHKGRGGGSCAGCSGNCGSCGKSCRRNVEEKRAENSRKADFSERDLSSAQGEKERKQDKDAGSVSGKKNGKEENGL